MAEKKGSGKDRPDIIKEIKKGLKDSLPKDPQHDIKEKIRTIRDDFPSEPPQPTKKSSGDHSEGNE